MAAIDEIIQRAIQLPFEQRAAVLVALQESMQPSLPNDAVEQAWSDEIRHRIEQLKNGEVQTVSSEEAWKRIDGEDSSDI